VQWTLSHETEAGLKGGGVNSGGLEWGKGTDKLTKRTPRLNVVFTDV
jgi:hypothetical protein